MDQIQHKYVEVKGLNLHVAEIEMGPTTVMFLHGFPEIWYSWRHQMIAVANAGYRAIAPNYRGYGLSDPPPKPEKTSFVDLVHDMVALLDALDIPKVSRVISSPTTNLRKALRRIPRQYKSIPGGKWKASGFKTSVVKALGVVNGDSASRS